MAQGMIARHGADAAREATIHLNQMIHERQNGNNGIEMVAG